MHSITHRLTRILKPRGFFERLKKLWWLFCEVVDDMHLPASKEAVPNWLLRFVYRLRDQRVLGLAREGYARPHSGVQHPRVILTEEWIAAAAMALNRHVDSAQRSLRRLNAMRKFPWQQGQFADTQTEPNRWRSRY